jgi:hypothetical protein
MCTNMLKQLMGSLDLQWRYRYKQKKTKQKTWTDSFPGKNIIRYHQSEQLKHEHCDSSISGCSYLADQGNVGHYDRVITSYFTWSRKYWSLRSCDYFLFYLEQEILVIVIVGKMDVHKNVKTINGIIGSPMEVQI